MKSSIFAEKIYLNVEVFMIQRKIIRVLLYSILLVFVLLSLARSFGQYRAMRLDGDIAESVLPYPDIQKTFDDPTGIKTIINNDKHLGANRFFSHYFLHITFRKIPLFLQNFTNPIESVYLTSAISKTAMQIMILLLLVVILNGKTDIFSLRFISTAALLIPFFQTNGRYLAFQIGMIDKAVSYSFFYALPLVFLLLYYIPIFLELLHHKRVKMNGFKITLWSIFAIISCFSGPLNSPVILITNLLLFLYLFFRSWKDAPVESFYKRIKTSIQNIDKRFYLFLFPITFLALYSTFLGTYIDAYAKLQLSLKELYLILPQGVLNSFTSCSYLIFMFLLISNYLIVLFKYKNDEQSRRIFGLYKFLIAFSIIYLLLLPFGGYRPYRPLILRYDTIIPITVLSIITICYTSLFIFKQLKTEKWKYYLKTLYPSIYILILLFFLIKNQTYIFNKYEKTSLYLISQSEEEIIALQDDYCVISWGPLTAPSQSRTYGKLLYLWRITDEPKLYYNAPPQEP